MKHFKKWWFNRYSIVHVRFSVALSHLWLTLEILDYGIDFSINLPYVLDRLNLINWIAKKLFYLLCDPNSILTSKTWSLSKHKAFELQLGDVCEIVAFNYRWTVHEDHWGHWLKTSLVGLELSAHYYDGRHWDYKKDAPEEYGSSE